MTQILLHIAFLSAGYDDSHSRLTLTNASDDVERRIGVLTYSIAEVLYARKNKPDNEKPCLRMGEHLLPDISAKEWDNALRNAFEKAQGRNMIEIDLVSIQMENRKVKPDGRPLPHQFEN